MNDCVFCGIVKNNTPHHEIWYEGENHIGFLDIFPTGLDHTLVVPKKHTDNILDLSSDEYVDLFKSVQIVSKKLQEYSKASRITIVVDGWSVSHVHVHLIPTFGPGGLGESPKYILEENELVKRGGELRNM
jgi:histidine triad (HIT) family protein